MSDDAVKEMRAAIDCALYILRTVDLARRVDDLTPDQRILLAAGILVPYSTEARA